MVIKLNFYNTNRENKIRDVEKINVPEPEESPRKLPQVIEKTTAPHSTPVDPKKIQPSPAEFGGISDISESNG